MKDLKSWVRNFAKTLTYKDIVLLQGPMGVGKSQFTQFLVEALSSEQSCSPTYAIHNAYEGKEGPIDHIDLYRVEDEDDLESTGFWDLFDQEKAIICIEWSDRMEESVYPTNWKRHKLVLEPVSSNERLLTYSKL